jgi:2-dehydro-3-deoxy-L-rhamnonate dehydrogenase (NAD+)
MDNIRGKTIAITGAARGIGYATAKALLARGAKVVIGDRDVALQESAVADLGKLGQVSGYPLDVSDRESFATFLDKARTDGGGHIDVLINNAGIAGNAAPITEVTDDDWEVMLRVDLTSVFLCCRAVIPHMLSRQTGAIVNVASIAGKEGNPRMVPYSSAKAGVIGLTKALAKEVATAGVRVNAVAPAVIETAILKTLTPAQVDYMKSRIPMGRFGLPEEAAHVIAFLASPDSSFVTGQCYDVSGGRATY